MLIDSPAYADTFWIWANLPYKQQPRIPNVNENITLAINEVTEALPKIGRLSTAYESVVIGGEEDPSHASALHMGYQLADETISSDKECFSRVARRFLPQAFFVFNMLEQSEDESIFQKTASLAQSTGAQYHRWASAEPPAVVQQSSESNLHGLGPVAEVPGASEDWYFWLPENDRPDEEVAVQQVSASSCDRKSNFKNNVCATPGGGGGKFAGVKDPRKGAAAKCFKCNSPDVALCCTSAAADKPDPNSAACQPATENK
ncbi:hypothetical protein PCANC_04930 [Puccinia coronata f. sp. avenae]|uniref:Uncharacterized protein n=1 Tax=Puccinia coronata f. sp. avenae TaxID=200324 RepID=A0A2N5VWE9_9BASI|nr:hypothetical protein PCANC_04930 [Puccinia coronata f. sp. avenae]